MGLVKFLDLYNTYGGNSYDFANSGVSEEQVKSAVEAIIAALGFFAVIFLVLAVVVIIAKWKVFKKMGIDGWKSLINTVDTYLQMEATGVDQRWFLVFLCLGLACIIPILNFLVFFAIFAAFIYFWILLNVSLAKSFGKDSGFAVGLILLYPIFIMILAFGSSEYIGPTPMHDIIFGKKEKAAAPKVEEKAGKFCTSCGTKIEDDSKVCPNCGKEIE